MEKLRFPASSIVREPALQFSLPNGESRPASSAATLGSADIAILNPVPPTVEDSGSNQLNQREGIR